MIKKSFPVQRPYYYDTKEGIDNFTKLLIEENPKKLTDKEKQDIHLLGKNMKKAVLDHHIKTTKKFDNHDPSTYPSDPKVRGKLLEIERLEKDLAPPKLTNLPIIKNNINNRPRTGNPSGRDYWKEFVAGGGKELPEVSPEDKGQLSATDTWKAIYKGMTPFEKGQWNFEQNKKKIQRQKEFDAEKKEKRIKNHTMRQWGLADVLKLPNQELKSKMRDWISDADKEKAEKEKINKPVIKPEVKTMSHLHLPTFRPDETESVHDRIGKPTISPGLSIELVKLQKDINKNVDYVLGKERKEESRREETTQEEELK